MNLRKTWISVCGETQRHLSFTEFRLLLLSTSDEHPQGHSFKAEYEGKKVSPRVETREAKEKWLSEQGGGKTQR